MHVRRLRFVPLLLLALVLLWGAAACGRSPGPEKPPAPGPTDIPPPPLNARPDGLARTFLDLVRQERFDQAYGYLGTEAKARISPADFSRQLGEAMKIASTRLSFESRWVEGERIEGETAIVKVADRKYPEAQVWNWEFRPEGGAWKIQRLYMPPVVTHPGY